MWILISSGKNNISERAQRASKILFLTRQNVILFHGFAPLDNFLVFFTNSRGSWK